jgi:hypothetical protein
MSEHQIQGHDQVDVELYRSTYSLAGLVERLAYLERVLASVVELNAGGAAASITDWAIPFIQADIDAVTEARALLTYDLSK